LCAQKFKVQSLVCDGVRFGGCGVECEFERVRRPRYRVHVRRVIKLGHSAFDPSAGVIDLENFRADRGVTPRHTRESG